MRRKEGSASSSAAVHLNLKKRQRSPLPPDFSSHELIQEIRGQQRS
ncbi:hypothetical protein [Paenibacillus sp. 23TSA30-6]|nr:hypothetical protein [Paenibacillus sp. 23TSA30-6]